jgi:cytochrome c-type biogenesis protein CcmH
MDNWLFWAVAGATTLGVGFILLQALRQSATASDDGAALKVYRDQLTEVDRDLARNVISAAEADRLRTEVSRRLLDADRALQSAAPKGGKGSALPATLLIAALLGLGLYAYDRLGAPGYGDLPLATRLAMTDDNYRNRPSQAEAEAAAPAPEPVKTDPQFTELMTKLREVVKQRPDDPQGLALLAKNEAQLGNFAASREAYQHLLQVKGDSASVNDHLGLAQTMIIAAGGFVSPEAEQQLIVVLERDPTNGLARYFSGLMFAQIGRFDRAFALWEPLLREGPEDAPWMEPIRAGLQEVADRAGIKYQLPDAKGPSAGDVAAAGQMTPEARQEMIKGMVGQLESRLSTEGGPIADWLKLINALGVLGEADRAKTAAEQAKAAHPDQAAALDAALAALPKGPSASDVAAAAQMTPEDRQAMIAGMVGQLETRLYTDGGPLADWLKLMSSLMVLGDKPRATAAYEKAAAAFAADTQALGQIEAAASDAGITP